MKQFFTVALVLFSTWLNAQVIMPAHTLVEWDHLMEMSKNASQNDPSVYAKYPIYHINNEWYISLMGKVNPNADWSSFENNGVIRGCQIKDIATVKVPFAVFHTLDFNQVFSYLELPGKIAPHLDRARVDVRADSVQLGLGGLPEAYTGKDVLIGVTDWGFDYTHPMFYDTLLQQTRIVAAWDQYKNVGDAPASYGYGVEYNTIPELLSAGSDTANIYSYATHGSHVAGIAGGSGAGLPYRGMAPEAEFLFTTFLVDAASVIDAFHWMKSKSDELGKPLVVNMSWGLYYIGTLDGNSLLSQAIDGLSDEGVIFVASAGNNGDASFHIKKTFNNDALLSRIAFDSYVGNPNMWGESITIWGEPGHPFEVGLSLYTTVNVLLQQSPLYSTETAPAYFDSILVQGSDTIFYNITTEAAHPLNGRPHMRLRVKNTNNSIKVALNAEAESGTVHFWNLVELLNGVGNWGLGFSTVGVNGVNGDANYSIGEPTCTASCISVAAYSSGYINSQGNPAGGQIAPFTSIGPLMTEVMKPDIAAPGVNVASSMSSFTDSPYSITDYVMFNNTQYDFAKLSGTSMSSPCVTGIVALMLDANPALNAYQVKQILQTTARHDQYTGDITAPGDVRWGYGKINAYAAVWLALATIDVQEEERVNSAVISPNPAHELLTVKLSDEQKLLSVRAVDMSGKMHQLEVIKNQLNISSLANGIYVVEITTDKGVSYQKLVKE